MSKRMDKKFQLETDQRETLLMLDKKLLITNNDTLMDLLRLYEPIPETLVRYTKPELILKSMQDDWLLDVSIDENNLLRVRDLSVEEDWQIERRDKLIRKYQKAFGG